jgi:Holliday junction resolvase RusA-like endonuclease
VSLQANRSKKDRFCDALCSVLGEPEYLLSGEVSVSVEWMIHERLRYETLVTPDVDNTLKVVLDAISGPMGVLINDCQVHHVGCHWIDWTRPDEQVTVTIKHISDDWVRKKGPRIRQVRQAPLLAAQLGSSYSVASERVDHG